MCVCVINKELYGTTINKLHIENIEALHIRLYSSIYAEKWTYQSVVPKDGNHCIHDRGEYFPNTARQNSGFWSRTTSNSLLDPEGNRSTNGLEGGQ